MATFDARLGVSTSGITRSEELDFDDGEAQSHAVRYRASPPFSVRTGIAALRSWLPAFEEATFIDYGCGAGRVMLIAAELGFKRVIGLELSHDLAARCQENLDRYGRRRGAGHGSLAVEIANAMEYSPGPSTRVFFFFKPFDQWILDGVMKQIEASLVAAPRRVFVLTFQARAYDFSKTSFRKIAEVKAVEIFSNE